MTVSSLRRLAACPWVAGATLVLLCQAASAQPATPAAPPAQAKPPVVNSAIDAPLFYQLLIGEIELGAGQAGNAYQIMLDAARRTRDEQLFRRATEIALQARAGDQALAATRAWRTARPESLEAIRLQLQILLSMNRLNELPEPIRALIAGTPAAERAAVIGSLPRFMQRAQDKRQAAQLLEDVLQPYAGDASTRVATQVAIGRMWLAAGDADRALKLARQAQAEEPASSAAVLLALELMPTRPEAESLVTELPEDARGRAGRAARLCRHAGDGAALCRCDRAARASSRSSSRTWPHPG